MEMSVFTTVLIIVVALIGVGYVLIQRSHVTKLNNALANKDYEQVITLAQDKKTQFFLGKDNCSLYYLKSMYLGRGKEATKEPLKEYLLSESKLENKERVLDVYFHIYLYSNDRAYCDDLLEIMEEISGPVTYRYHRWAYDVVLDKNPNHIEEMEDAINRSELTGFPLGVATYMIGLSYELKGELEIAREWTYTAIDTFLPDNMYHDKAIKKTNELTKLIGDGKYLKEE